MVERPERIRMRTKILYSDTYGGFGFSKKFKEEYKKRYNEDVDEYAVQRHDPRVIKLVEDLGLKASGSNFAELKIKVISGIKYIIREYDGLEWIETPKDVEWVIIDTPEARKEYPEFFI